MLSSKARPKPALKSWIHVLEMHFLKTASTFITTNAEVVFLIWIFLNIFFLSDSTDWRATSLPADIGRDFRV